MKTLLAIVLWLVLIGFGLVYLLAPESYYDVTCYTLFGAFLISGATFGVWLLGSPVFNGRGPGGRGGWGCWCKR